MINTYSSHCISPLFLLFIQQLSLLPCKQRQQQVGTLNICWPSIFYFLLFLLLLHLHLLLLFFIFPFLIYRIFFLFPPFFLLLLQLLVLFFFLYFFSLSFFFPSCFSSSVLPFHNFTFCYASATEGGAGGIMFSGCTSVRPYVRPSVRPSRLTVITISQEPFKI